MDTANEYGTLEIQKGLLALLKEFDAVCREHDIPYTVSGGTLLGTIRHQGFIPWDDDLDVIMDRSSYLKLSSILPTGHLSVERDTDGAPWVDRVRLDSHERTDGTAPTLDLFVMVARPDNSLSAWMKVTALRALQGMLKRHPAYPRYSWAGKVFSFMTSAAGRLFSAERKMKWYHRISVLGDSKESRYTMLCNDCFRAIGYRYPRHLTESYVRMRFEDTHVNAMCGWDEYLTIIYGDYMTPPPSKERIPKHH